MGKFEDALEFLKTKEDGGEDLAAAVLDRIQKVNGEAKSLRERAKKAETAAEKFTAISEILEDNDIDLDGDLQEQFDTVLKKSKTADSSNSALKKMERQLKKLEDKIATAEAENERLTQVGNRSKIKDALSSAFSEKILNSNIALDYRIEKGDFVLSEDGEVAYKVGDELITENIMETYIKNNPGEVRNTQTPGGGSSPGGGSPKTPFNVESLKSMTPDQFASLSDNERAEIQTVISTGS